MQIRDVMTTQVQTIHPDAPVQEAADRMRMLDVGSLPVSDGDRLVGIITDRDIAVRSTASGDDPSGRPVRDVMTPDVVACMVNDDVGDAARLMQDRQIRRIPVINDEDRLVGIVALGDIATTTDEHLTGETLREISEPAHPPR